MLFVGYLDSPFALAEASDLRNSQRIAFPEG
jgi:hypothetical protein